MGERDNCYQYLITLTPNEWKMYLTLQKESNWNSVLDEDHRYIDYTDLPLKTLYDKACLSEKTGIKCLKSLQTKRMSADGRHFIELVTYNDNMNSCRKHIRIPNDIGATYTKCNLDLDLYKMLSRTCKPVVVKLYLFHCNRAGIAKKTTGKYVYKQSLKNIADCIGVSRTNLKTLISANQLLKQLGVIDIDKKWVHNEHCDIHCENIYTFKHENRVDITTVKSNKP